ncbi:DinB family protein [Niabella ginsengisoli]|uniref:DinB family protein n=1 Tax=Niabella ginsengisoli TaxID=522298 RepID=A0ABS9SFL6_9BACT|nr:DinB family protein [Niabella ginsengisoli]MCH5597151.1 DinB family protein [Niabella ginsengisoli]
MKSFLFIIGLTTLFSFTIFDPITDKERADLLSYRNASKALLLSEVKGLSDEQLNWKPNDSAWSIANCVEHITLTEKSIFEWAMGTLKESADSTKNKK